jgi:sterol desaturase/sphingolipid hydroxylase (fatty acid hydroxylase superfamily)
MFIETNETAIRLSAFICVFIIMAVLEHLFPRKKRVMPRAGRWFTNFGLVVLNSIVLRVAVPVVATEAAFHAVQNGWGILSFTLLPTWLEFIAAIILLDMFIYLQHVLMHKIPVLWRLHKIHHADRDLDASSGLRFHPFEIIISMGFKLAFVIIIGAPVASVIIFEVILNAGSIFNHANFHLHKAIDKILRYFIVTPDFHRVHHSVHEGETNSNYGFFLTCWDMLFTTYTSAPKDGHNQMTIGLSEYENDDPKNMLWCLIEPFRKIIK